MPLPLGAVCWEDAIGSPHGLSDIDPPPAFEGTPLIP